MNNASEFGSARGRSVVPGILLVTAGLFFLAVNYLEFDVEQVWPLVLLVPSVVFFVMGLRDRKLFGLFMPAAILFVLGGLFLVCQWYGWYLMQSLWPLFMLAPGLGLFLMYLLGRRETGLLIPASILTGLSIVFLLAANGFGRFWPVILILVGVGVLLGHRKSTPVHDEPLPPPKSTSSQQQDTTPLS